MLLFAPLVERMLLNARLVLLQHCCLARLPQAAVVSTAHILLPVHWRAASGRAPIYRVLLRGCLEGGFWVVASQLHPDYPQRALAGGHHVLTQLQDALQDPPHADDRPWNVGKCDQ